MFVDIEKEIPDILIDVVYATERNFVGKAVYPIAKCFLRAKVAGKLKRVQLRLKSRGLGLKIFDGYRPLSVQKIFWSLVPDDRYVAPPDKGSKHNRGAAVDVTLVDLEGRELLMPSLFDELNHTAHRDFMECSEAAILHRSILEEAMKEEGFIPLPTEWWHFDDADWESYPIEDISLESLESSLYDG
ncbi:MAG: M15 family metallopeptidase [Simkaniaceae bacterium]|nr:M15 family metallopeptidase [Simkaniaceae bacterium]